jgi:hypothetical protein
VWYTQGSDLLLLGFDGSDHPLDVPKIARRFEQQDFAAGFARAGIDDLPSLFAHELLPLGVLNAASLKGPVHTLHRPILSDMAARAFFVGRRANLPKYPGLAGARIGRRNSLLRRLTKSMTPAEYEHALEAATRETCARGRGAECATLLTRWRQAGEQGGVGDYLRELRRESPAADGLKESNLRRIEVLLAGRPRRVIEGRSLPRAKVLSDTFMRHYHYAEPFDRRALTIAWDQCRNDGCAEAREHLEDRIGSLRAAGGRRRGL